MAQRRNRVEAEVEADLQNLDMWEPLPEEETRRGPLGTQVSIRLDAEDAVRLRRVADARGVGYTSLLREWIRERLYAEERLLTTYSYETNGSAGTSNVEVSSKQYHIRELAIA